MRIVPTQRIISVQKKNVLVNCDGVFSRPVDINLIS